MKKTALTIFVIFLLSFSLISCVIPVNTDTDSTSNTEGITNTDTSTESNNAVDTSIKIETDYEREMEDGEFPFESIIIEPRGLGGYDLVAAGEYYGKDFENVKYYGSYYRFIDNYNDFSELTQWGKIIEESVFENNVILVLFNYKNYYKFYFVDQGINGPGAYNEFTKDKDTGGLIIEEVRVIVRSTPDTSDYLPPPHPSENCYLYPSVYMETIYLLIPKEEMPKDIDINGEINVSSLIRIFD